MQPISSDLFERVRRLQIATHHLAEEMMTGLYHSAFKGQGMEFEEVREYQPGDEVRHIDWNVTARMQHPYTKVFREERETAVWLLVDISLSQSYGSGAIIKREYAAEVASLLAFAAVKNNDRVGLILFSDCIEGALSPTKGNRHATRLTHEVMTRPVRGKGSDLSVALLRLGRLQRRRCICFLISDFLCAVSKKAVQLISKHHDLIAIMVGDPTEKAFPLPGLVTVADSETGEIASIDLSKPPPVMPLTKCWREHTEVLRSCGVDVIQLRSDQPSYHALRKFFCIRTTRGKGSG